MQKAPSNANGFEPFEYVFEQQVKATKLDSYYKFNEQLHLLASQQPGYIYHGRRLLPGDGEIRHFQTLLRFDSPENCINWLEHPERRRLLRLEEEQNDFHYSGHGNWQSYGRWLARSITKKTPKWKVSLLVLLTLYPTVMLLTPLLHLSLKGVAYPVVMLISNSLCVAATSWILVPTLSRFYSDWLQGNLGRLQRWLALASLIILFILLLNGFLALPKSLWG
jgi:antibiotic biosynthesis monooxygenase (ABM) superfamily enzyme